MAGWLTLLNELKETSHDPSKKNAAVIVASDGSGRVIGAGVNNFLPGVAESAERWERPLKYSFIEHAERAAVYDAARRGNMTEGATMYCLWFSCADCARAIVASGIKKIVGLPMPNDEPTRRWIESIKLGDTILSEGGVEIVRMEVG